jgi:hypothetical protein
MIEGMPQAYDEHTIQRGIRLLGLTASPMYWARTRNKPIKRRRVNWIVWPKGLPVNQERKDAAMKRDFVEYEADSGPYRTLNVHQVTEDTAGEVPTVNGTVTVQPGQYIVSTGNPQFYDVYDENAFNELGFSATRDQRDLESGEAAAEATDESEQDFFEPSEHTAREVHEYLSSDDVSDENKERVRAAEEGGANRKSAFPKE